MRSLMRLFRNEPAAARPLYDQVVARARQPHWYVAGQVPDTLEGRFAVLATLLALVDLRLERGADTARRTSVGLAECFVADMEMENRQLGVSDTAIGKKVGSLVGALGGRVGAWRRAVDGEESWESVLGRSMFRGQPAADEAVAHVEGELRAFWAALQGREDEALINGALP
jgi:cytochrome b pre-mRNA-processing protein 3